MPTRRSITALVVVLGAILSVSAGCSRSADERSPFVAGEDARGAAADGQGPAGGFLRHRASEGGIAVRRRLLRRVDGEVVEGG